MNDFHRSKALAEDTANGSPGVLHKHQDCLFQLYASSRAHGAGSASGSHPCCLATLTVCLKLITYLKNQAKSIAVAADSPAIRLVTYRDFRQYEHCISQHNSAPVNSHGLRVRGRGPTRAQCIADSVHTSHDSLASIDSCSSGFVLGLLFHRRTSNDNPSSCIEHGIPCGFGRCRFRKRKDVLSYRKLSSKDLTWYYLKSNEWLMRG